MTIGERIKQRRMELGMSQEELAHKLGYKSRSFINKIELGGQNLTQKRIKKIADALDTTPEYIMGWNPPKEFRFQPRFNERMYIKLSEGMEDFLKKASEERMNQLFDYMNFLIMQDKEDDKS